uniref:Nucleoporin 210-like n=1 Tax=Jaculus jaculus TaxID=51337 RepID=A0A8C5K677_JACJA
MACPGACGSPSPALVYCFLVAYKLNVPQVLLAFSREPGRVPFVLAAQRGWRGHLGCRPDLWKDGLVVRALSCKFCSLRHTILKYSEAQYTPQVYIADMEKKERQGDMILVSGIRTGAAVVKVRIYDPFYKVNICAMVFHLIVLPMERLKVHALPHPAQLIFLSRDSDVHMQSVSALPNCTIYVVEPGFLGFTIYPGNRWSLEVGQVYVITVEVFDKSSTKVYISDGLERDGNTQPTKSPIKHQQEVKIYFPIKLTPSFLAFPYYPLGPLNHYQVQVEGGSGNFTWASSNETVALVTTKGVVTAGQIAGNSTILARDIQNPFRYGEIKVYVMKLNKMELLPFRADVQVGQIIEIPIAMYHVNKETREATAFSDCSHLPLDVNSEKQGVFILFKEGIRRRGPAHCSSAHIAATAPGHTLVTVSVAEYEGRPGSSATFAAYEALKAVNPVEVALVTWQSVKEMVFEGGPHPWVLEPSRFFVELSMEKTEEIRVTEVRLPAKRTQKQYIYQVLCLDVGAQVLTLRIGNHPGVLNPSPAVEAVQVHFLCAHPASMLVTPVYRVADGTQPCPLPQYNKQLIPVSSRRDTVLELVAFDQHGRKFDNFSSLMLEWKTSNETLAHFEDSKSMEMVARDDGSGQTRLHGQQTLKVHHMTGTVLIRVHFVGYSEKKSLKGISSTSWSATVELLLVDDVTVWPKNATIYNHPSVKEIFNLVEGSGYFLVHSSEQGIVTVTYTEAESSVQVTPERPGSVTLEVYDLCLGFLGPVRAHLRVSDIHELELDLIDKVEIGKTVSVAVRALASSKHPFRSKYFRNMELKLQAASAIVTLTLMEEQDEYSENYVLQAITVGQTTLVAVGRDKMGRKVTSAPRQIEVRNELIQNSGPQPQSIIHFSISNHTVAVVNRRGQVTGKGVGSAVVRGTIQTVNEDTGKVIVFSQDEVQIAVVRLSAVRVLAAATRLVTAAEMPVYVMGVTGTQTPFSFGNANPRLTFHWSVSKRDVLDLVPRHSEVFLQLPAENNFAMVVHTKTAGKTTVKVTVRSTNSSEQFEGNLLELSDEVQILVFEKLQLFYPDCQPEQILMPMNSQLKLHTNREGAAIVRSRVLQCFPNSSVVEDDGEGLLRSGSAAGTAVLEVTAVEPFGVNQTTIMGVQVAPVTYLWLSSHSKLYTAQGKTLSAFPLGMSLTFTVQFYNSIGEKFYTHNTQLYLALNRDDLLLIGPGNRNHTYTAQAVNRGVTIVGLWDQRHPGMADYIPVAVEHAIEPNTRDVFVGDVICFSTQLVDQHGEPGMWMVSADNTLQIDNVTGVAVARSPGTATVFHDIPGVVKTYREVVVNASSILTLGYDLKTHLTNTPNSTVFKLFISTGKSDVNLKGSCTPNQALAITTVLLPETLVLCHVQFSSTLLDIPASQVFHVHSDFSMEKGVYVCVIEARPKSELTQALSMADTSVYAWATLVSERSKSGVPRVLIPFIPAFYVNQSELVLDQKGTVEIGVLGVDTVLEHLKVFSSSPFLAVFDHRHSTFVPGLAVYLVKAVNFTAFQHMNSPLFINVSCALTRQNEVVVVKTMKDKSSAGQCDDAGVSKQLTGSYQAFLFTVCVLLASTALMFLAYNAFLNKLQTVPVVYVQTTAPQPGSHSTRSPHLAGPQPPPAQSRLQHWLWSIRH